MLNETKATIEQTIAFARELNLDFYGFSLTTPLPGTELYKTAIKRGVIQSSMNPVKEWDVHVNANLTQDCSNRDLLAFESKAFKEFNLQKFGRFYMFTPDFWREAMKLLLSIRNKAQVEELVHRVRGIARTY